MTGIGQVSDPMLAKFLARHQAALQSHVSLLAAMLCHLALPRIQRALDAGERRIRIDVLEEVPRPIRRPDGVRQLIRRARLLDAAFRQLGLDSFPRHVVEAAKQVNLSFWRVAVYVQLWLLQAVSAELKHRVQIMLAAELCAPAFEWREASTAIAWFKPGSVRGRVPVACVVTVHERSLDSEFQSSAVSLG